MDRVPAMMIKRVLLCLGVFLIPQMVWAASIQLSGKTMGTTYHIKVVLPAHMTVEALQTKVDARLRSVNQSMSTFLENSEISRFNQLKTINTPFTVSEGFYQVMMAASNIFRQTEGAWDGTIRPLVNLWGFGTGKIREDIPSESDIKALLADVGFGRIIISKGALTKTSPGITLDLASIAKGYGVDDVAALLMQEGIHRFLVEIGGEVVAKGRKENGEKWKVGVNTPRKGAPQGQVYEIVELSDKAMATSGDYRNFFERQGKTYTHVIDPRTGYPVSNGVVSASVISDTCMMADGLATAVMVMGHEKGLDMVNRLAGTECLIIVGKQDGSLENIYSSGFHTYTYTPQ